MDNKELLLQKCPKCGSCGVTEVKRQWEDDVSPGYLKLVAYFKCESCSKTWEILLERKPATQ